MSHISRVQGHIGGANTVHLAQQNCHHDSVMSQACLGGQFGAAVNNDQLQLKASACRACCHSALHRDAPAPAPGSTSIQVHVFLKISSQLLQTAACWDHERCPHHAAPLSLSPHIAHFAPHATPLVLVQHYSTAQVRIESRRSHVPPFGAGTSCITKRSIITPRAVQLKYNEVYRQHHPAKLRYIHMYTCTHACV